MIELREVAKSYGREIALDHVTFSLERGKIYGLLGPNGSGKSTTLKLIAGLAQPSSGKVIINEKIAQRKMASDVAYLSELDHLYPSFTVKAMIEYYDSQFADFQMGRAEELIRFMKLDPNKKIKGLSKGNRGRLKLVLVLARKAPILLLDEPFSGLDPMVRDSIVKGLVSFLDFENQIVIIATHEIDEIESLLDEVLAIRNGKLIARVNTEDLREKEGLSVLQWMKKTFKE